MRKQSLAKNFMFQFAYQAVILVVPLIMSPYLTRTLMPDALGTYTYVNSIAYYFIIAANLGISVHGRRLISRVSSDESLLRKSFWSLFYAHVGISIAVSGVYFVAIQLIHPENQTIYVISGIYVLSALFDITWLFYGLEYFSSVVIKNAVVKVVECILIFCIVKTPNDLWKYTLIVALGGCVGQMVMLPQAIKIVPPIKISAADLKAHLKPLLIFSVSVIATALYTVFDKTLLGILTTKADVAYYEYSHRIVAIPQTIIGVIGTVMMPRACRLAMEENTEDQRKYMTYSFYLTAFIGMAALFGICAVSNELAVVYYGESFEACGNIMKALSPLAYIVGTGSVLRSQCLIPNGMDKQFNTCIVYNAIINLVLSLIFIKTIGVYGAVLGTLIAEVFGLAYQTVLCKKFICWRTVAEPFISFSIIGVAMLCIVKLVASFMPMSVSSLVIQVVVGACAYFALTIIYFFVFKRATMKTFLKTLATNKGK